MQYGTYVKNSIVSNFDAVQLKNLRVYKNGQTQLKYKRPKNILWSIDKYT